MKKFVVWAFINLVVLNITVAQASSQKQLTGKISVDGNPLSNAVVTLYLLNKAQSGYDRSISSRTAENGIYKIDSISDGIYALIVTKEGQRVYQGKVSINESSSNEKNIDLTAFLFTGKWKLNLQKSKIPSSYQMIDSTRTYSKKGDIITVQWTQSFKNGKTTANEYKFNCDGKNWNTGGQNISCRYKFDGNSAVVEGEKSPPHEYFRNEVKNNILVISTYKDSQYNQLISMFVFDPAQ